MVPPAPRRLKLLSLKSLVVTPDIFIFVCRFFNPSDRITRVYIPGSATLRLNAPLSSVYVFTRASTTATVANSTGCMVSLLYTVPFNRFSCANKDTAVQALHIHISRNNIFVVFNRYCLPVYLSLQA